MSDIDDKTRIALLEQSVCEIKKSTDRSLKLSEEINSYLRTEAVQGADIRNLAIRIKRFEDQCDSCSIRINSLERNQAGSTASRRTALAMITILVAMAGAFGGMISLLIGKS